MNDSKQTLWEALEKTLAQIENRLSQVEQKLVQLDQRPRPMFSENRVVETAGLLGGRDLIDYGDNGIVRLTRQPACDNCGKIKVDVKDFIICNLCRRKVCQSCGIAYSNSYYCISCLRKLIPIDKSAYKVLVAVAKQVTHTSVMSELTKIPRRKVEDCLTELSDENLVMKRGLSLFSRLSVTELGLEAIGVLRGVYGLDEDSIQFDSELSKYCIEKMARV
jgi:hypothetical protein